MSNSRQPNTSKVPTPVVRSLALRLPSQYRIDDHSHSWAQVVYAARGVLRVESATRQWVVPPHRSLWVPADTPHAIEMAGEVWMRTIYLAGELVTDLPATIRVMDVSPLLRELILEVVRLGMLDDTNELHRHSTAVLIAHLASASELHLDIPLPADPRARRVADHVLRQLDHTTSLNTLAQDVGAGERTIERLFLEETGLSFGRWRQQARLQHAVCRLAEGNTVTSVALECGYESVSAFVAMFRQSLGTTPGQYLRDARESGQTFADIREQAASSVADEALTLRHLPRQSFNHQ